MIVNYVWLQLYHSEISRYTISPVWLWYVYHTALPSQKAVSAYLPFDLPLQHSSHHFPNVRHTHKNGLKTVIVQGDDRNVIYVSSVFKTGANDLNVNVGAKVCIFHDVCCFADRVSTARWDCSPYAMPILENNYIWCCMQTHKITFIFGL